MTLQLANHQLVLSCSESWQSNRQHTWFLGHFYQVWSKRKEGRWKKKAKTNQQCTLTETCFSHLNCAVKVILIIHTPSVIVAEMGDWSALFPFLVLSFIFHGFSVLPIATDDIGFIALFSLHWNSEKNGRNLFMLPWSILEVESPTGLGGLCFFLYCLSFIIN